MNKFIKENIGHFEDKEENKLIYTEIFTNYVRTKTYFNFNGILDETCGRLPRKETIITLIVVFYELLHPTFKVHPLFLLFLPFTSKRKEEISGDVFDLLSRDFEDFKDMMISSKVNTENFVDNNSFKKNQTMNNETGLSITVIPLKK